MTGIFTRIFELFTIDVHKLDQVIFSALAKTWQDENAPDITCFNAMVKQEQDRVESLKSEQLELQEEYQEVTKILGRSNGKTGKHQKYAEEKKAKLQQELDNIVSCNNRRV